MGPQRENQVRKLETYFPSCTNLLNNLSTLNGASLLFHPPISEEILNTMRSDNEFGFEPIVLDCQAILSRLRLSSVIFYLTKKGVGYYNPPLFKILIVKKIYSLNYCWEYLMSPSTAQQPGTFCIHRNGLRKTLGNSSLRNLHCVCNTQLQTRSSA
jgi:hypothetical protein